MALLISHYKDTDLQIGTHTLRYLGREQSGEMDFLFRLTTDQGQITNIAIPLGAKNQILDEVMVKVVPHQHMTREAVVQLRIEAPRNIQINRLKSE